MRCRVCGSESGKYPLCKVCNLKKEKGEIIKCSSCGNWHYTNIPCNKIDNSTNSPAAFLYDPKKTLVSISEQAYFAAILSSLPSGYHAFPQINLASFISKNDDSPFHNELFRNVDFLVTNEKYSPLFVIEINDQTHLNQERKERDEKVQKICEEAGIPIVKFWTSYGVDKNYISKKINETISSLPIPRTHHFDRNSTPNRSTPPSSIPINHTTPKYSYNRSSKRSGCYVATCIYGSYDCPEVWVLRRYRDTTLASTWHGRLFIKLYYSISPTLVKLFGKSQWFRRIFRPMLDKMVSNLSAQGVKSTPYEDITWN